MITYANAPIIVWGPALKITRFNRAFEQLTGYSANEVLGQKLSKLFPEASRAESLSKIADTVSDDHWESVEIPILHKDEKVSIVLWNSANIYAEDGEMLLSTIAQGQDITERVQARKSIAHLNLVLRSIRNVNQLIIREKNRGVLIHEICDTLIETRGYSTAWIMLLDERGKYLDSAESGLGKDFTLLLKELKRGDFPACLQLAQAQQRPVEIDDPSSTCADCIIMDKYSYKGRMTVRLEYAEKIYGVLSVSYGVDITVDDDELSLFEEVAGDIAFAIYNIKLEENIKQGVQNLQESEEYLKTVFETTSLATAIIDEDTTLSMVNKEFERLSGYSKEELEGKKSWTEFVAAEDLKRMKDHHQQRRIDPDTTTKQYEFRFINREGIDRTILLYVDMIPGTKKSVASLLDITERKQKEQEIEMLLDLSRKAGTETNLEDLLFFIADQIVEVITPAETASIFFYNEERETLEVQAWAGFVDSEINGLEFSIEDSQVGRIFRTKKPTLIKDVSESPDFKPIDKPSLIRVKSQMAVPLLFGKRIIGIMFADNLTRINAFSQKNLDLLESIGNQLAGVIENALLLDQVMENHKRLSQSEKNFRDLVANSPYGIIIADELGKHLFVNKRVSQITGYSLEELLILSIEDMTPPEELAKLKKRYLDRIAGEPVPNQYERLIVRKNGTTVLTELNTAVTMWEGNKCGMAIIRDITERKQAEEKLRQSEEQYHSVVEDSPGVIIRFTPDGTIIFANQEYCKFFGIKLNELVDMNIQSTILEEDRESVMSHIASLIEESPIKTSENKVIRHDGVIRWMRWADRALFDDQGQIISIQSFGQDITRMIGVEQELRLEQEKAQKYLGIAEVIMLALNKKGEITLINQKGNRILGYQEDELIGKNWFETCLPERNRKETKQVFKNIMAGGTEFIEHHENPILTRSGEVRIIAWHNTALRDEKGNNIGTLSSGEDITERARAEEQNRIFNKIIETTSQSVIITNIKGTVLYVNPSYYAFSGFVEDEVIGKSMYSFANKKGALKLAKEVVPALIKKRHWQGEMTVVKKDKQIVLVNLTCSLLSDEKNKPEFFVAVFSDITERVRAEQLLNALNRAAVAMGAAQTHQEIFNAISEELKQLGISCMLFPIDDTRRKLITKYISYESALLNAAEKLVGIKHEDFSFPIDAVDMYREVVKNKKSLFSDSSEQTLQQILPKFAKNLLAQIIKLLHVQKSISVPLIVEGQVIGVFSVQADHLIQKDIPAATAFADQLSSAWNKIGLVQNLRKTVEGTIHTIAATVEARDPYTAGHQTRVADLAAAIASEMGLASDQVEGIKMAGVIHDLGKVQIPAEILSKPGIISGLEYEMIKIHPKVGFDLLKDIEFPWPIAEMVLQHHEMINGTGYPQGLKGDEILLEARILAVADIVEAMSSHRPYRPALGIEKALDQIKKDKGTLLDPDVVDACLKIFKVGYKIPVTRNIELPY